MTKQILIGPRGGQYWLDDAGKKHYISSKKTKSGISSSADNSGKQNVQAIKAGTKKSGTSKRVETKPLVPETKYIHFGPFPISDYEHEGDIEHEKQYILSLCPEAKNFHGWEERDREREEDFYHDYGYYDDEGFYQGYLEFDAPETFNYAW